MEGAILQLLEQAAASRRHKEIGAMTAAERAVFSLQDKPTYGFTTVTKKYRVKGYLGGGKFGVVLSAESISSPEINVAVKLQFEEDSIMVDAIDEGILQRYLTSLWVDNGPDTGVFTPIMKVYDYVRKPAKITLKMLTDWSMDGDVANIDKLTEKLFKVVAGLMDEQWKYELSEHMRGYKVPKNLKTAAALEKNKQQYIDKFKSSVPATEAGNIKAMKGADKQPAMGVFLDNNPKWPLSVSLLVAERLTSTLHDHAADFSIVRQTLAQVLLTLHMLQNMTSFVHGDCHEANIFLQWLEEPTTLRYAVGTNMVFYVNTSWVAKLGDFGFAAMDIPATHTELFPKARLYDNKRYYNNSGYTFEENGNNWDYRPWQDQLRLAWGVASHMAHESRENNKSVPRDLTHLVACMMTMKNKGISVNDDVDEEFAAESNRIRRLVADGLEAHAGGPLSQQLIEYIESAEKKSYRFFVPDATSYMSPRDIIYYNMATFSGIISEIPARGSPIKDMTLQIGDRTPGALPAWSPLPSANIPLSEWWSPITLRLLRPSAANAPWGLVLRPAFAQPDPDEPPQLVPIVPEYTMPQYTSSPSPSKPPREKPPSIRPLSPLPVRTQPPPALPDQDTVQPMSTTTSGGPAPAPGFVFPSHNASPPRPVAAPAPRPKLIFNVFGPPVPQKREPSTGLSSGPTPQSSKRPLHARPERVDTPQREKEAAVVEALFAQMKTEDGAI